MIIRFTILFLFFVIKLDFHVLTVLCKLSLVFDFLLNVLMGWFLLLFFRLRLFLYLEFLFFIHQIFIIYSVIFRHLLCLLYILWLFVICFCLFLAFGKLFLFVLGIRLNLRGCYLFLGLILSINLVFSWLIFVIPLLSFISSDFSPFNLALMDGLVSTKYFNLIFKLFAFDSTSCSLSPFVAYKSSLIDLYLFLLALLHL